MKDNNVFNLLTSLNDVEETYIKESMPQKAQKEHADAVTKHRPAWHKWGTLAASAVAACLCITVISSATGKIQWKKNVPNKTPQSNAYGDIPSQSNAYGDIPSQSDGQSSTPNTSEFPLEHETVFPAPTVTPGPGNANVEDNHTPSGTDVAEPGRVISWLPGGFQEDEGFVLWNGKYVTYRLETLLDKSYDGELFAICARPNIDHTFSHNGKTISEYYQEWGRLSDLPEKLQQLLKEGDALKYGEALYLTGTPDGERWSQELYEKRIEFYGPEIMSAYFADGEFLKDKVLEAINSFWLDLDGDGYISTDDMEATWKLETLPAGLKALKDAETACKDAIYANLAQLAPSLPGAYPSKVLGEKNCILFYMTKEDFAAFSREEWFFDLAWKDDVDYTDGVIYLINEVNLDYVVE